MPADIGSLLKLEVPLIVQIARRSLHMREIVGLAPGSIIELPKQADEELEILVNNRVIGCGRAVKVGENFGVRISFMGDLRNRVMALGEQPEAESDEDDPIAVAAQLLSGV